MLKILILVSAFANLITSYKNPKFRLSELHSGYPKEYSDYKKLHYYLQNVPRKMHYVETRKSYDPSKAVRHKRPDIYFFNRTKNLTASTNQQPGSQNDYNSISSTSTTDNGLGTTTGFSEFTTVHTETTTAYSGSTTPFQETTTAYSGSTCSESTPTSTECTTTNQQTSTVSTKCTSPETTAGSTTTIEPVSTSTTQCTQTTTPTTTQCNPPKSTSQLGDDGEKQASIESNQTINVGKVTCPVCHTPILINLEII